VFDKLGLELLEVLGRAQLRICLGDGEQASEGLTQDTLGGAGGGGPGGGHRFGARIGHGLEDIPLVRGVALDRLDEILDQIVAALELDVDSAPCLVDHVSRCSKVDQPPGTFGVCSGRWRSRAVAV
jgi:hypothetical protein